MVVSAEKPGGVGQDARTQDLPGIDQGVLGRALGDYHTGIGMVLRIYGHTDEPLPLWVLLGSVERQGQSRGAVGVAVAGPGDNELDQTPRSDDALPLS